MSGFIGTRMGRILKEDVRIFLWGFDLLLTFLVDYNSWVESDKALRLASTLDKDTIIVEGNNSGQR